MGQQQLLLIVLAAIVVGIAGYGAKKVMDAYNQSNDEEIIRQQMDAIIVEAKKFSAKSTTQGGGAGSITGFVPPSTMLDNGRTSLNTMAFGDWLIFQGYGSVNGKNGTSPVYLVGIYRISLQEWVTIVRVN